ncbi:MAG: hypothetical protein NT077_01755 [Candidatus Taylorbacteria bacterium]|nr:hypothetical protein [Candidatus Taylorbacteria bacterium]
MNKKYLPTILAITVLILGPISVNAWTAAPASPSAGNVSGPLNTGDIAQSKVGGLILNNNGNSSDEYGLRVPSGKVGIGKTVLTDLFEIWYKTTTSESFIFTVDGTTGYVGIGTQDPASRLSVNGGIQPGFDPANCVAAKSGTLRWNAGTATIQVCNDASTWVNI